MSEIMKNSGLTDDDNVIPEGIYPLIDSNEPLENKQYYNSVEDNKKYENELLEKTKSLEIFFTLKKLVDEKIIVNLILKYQPHHTQYEFYTINPSITNYNVVLPKLLKDLKGEDTYHTVLEVNKYIESIESDIQNGEIKEKMFEMRKKSMYNKEFIVKKKELDVYYCYIIIYYLL